MQLSATNKLQGHLSRWNISFKTNGFYRYHTFDEKRIHVLKKLCKKGADFHYLENERGFFCIPKVFWSKRLIEFFVDKGLSVNSKDEYHNTALHLVLNIHFLVKTFDPADGNHVINFLLDHGADINARNLRGQTPLLIVSGHPRTMGSAPRSLPHAWPVLETLMAKGADPTIPDNDGKNVLHQLPSCFAVSSLLLSDLHDDIDARTTKWHYHQTPLMLAARENRRDYCAMLIEEGAQVNAIDFQGYTALHHAVLNGSDRCVELLMDAGADTLAKTASGRSTFDFAIMGCRAGYNVIMAVEWRKKVATLELAGAAAITKYLNIPCALYLWPKAMRLCRLWNIQPSVEFLENYEHLKVSPGDIPTNEMFLRAVKTLVRLSSEETRFWRLLWFTPTEVKTVEKSTFVFTMLSFWAKDLKRPITEFASLENVDVLALYDLSFFFCTFLGKTENHKEIAEEICYMISIMKLVIVCFEKRILETESSVIPDKHWNCLYGCAFLILVIINKWYIEDIRKLKASERLLRRLIKLNLQDSAGNGLLHFLVKEIVTYDFAIITLLSELDNKDLRPIHLVPMRNMAGFEAVQTIDWEDGKVKRDLDMCDVMLALADGGAHVDARNVVCGKTLRDKFLEVKKKPYLAFSYDSLQCLCARFIARSQIPFKERVPEATLDFIRLHV